MDDFSDTLAKDVRDIKKLDDNRKFLLLMLFVVLFVISVLVGGFLAQNRPQTQVPQTAPQRTTKLKPTTTLSIVSTSKTLKQGTTEKVTVNLEKTPVTAIDIVLNYDPNLLTVSNIENGTVFARVIRKKIETGKIIYSAAIDTASKTALQTGPVFSFSIRALKSAGSAKITFDPSQTITALNGENTLGSSLGASFNLQ